MYLLIQSNYFVIFIKFNNSIILMSQEGKKYDCQCGASFDTVEELDKHNHEAH
jgi:hypothetical protein